MKKVIFIIAFMASLFTSSAQSYSNNLKKHCIIYPDAQLIINNAISESVIVEMSEYKKDVDGDEFTAEMSILYEWGHADVPLCKVANNMWLLISKQLHGEKGKLTLSKVNFIPTRNEEGKAILAILMWNKTKNKWAIMSMPLFRIKTLYKGSRMFSPRA